MIGYDSAGDGRSRRSQSIRNSMAVLPYTGGNKGSGVRNFKALQQIEKIKRSKQEKEEQKRLEEERRKLQSERQRKKLKEELTKRKIEHGVVSQNTDLKALIYNDTGDLSKKQQNQKILLPQIRLLDLEEEETRDKELVLEFLKKYSKLWKNLFYKYANSGFSSKQINNFDQLEEKHNTLNVAEATKLLKDHSAYPQLLNKEELLQLFRLINTKVYSSSDLQALDYTGF